MGFIQLAPQAHSKVALPDISSWDVAKALWWVDVVLCAHKAEVGLLDGDQQLGTAMSL